jgi:hypothetical protein
MTGMEIAVVLPELHGDQSMSAKVILPSFNIPSQGPHPAVLALWASGGLVLIAALVLGGAMWHRHAVDLAAEAATARVLAAVAEQQQVAVPEPAHVAAAAQPAAMVAAAPKAEVPAEARTVVAAPTPVRHHGGARHHRMHVAKTAHGKAVAARDGRGSRNSTAKKEDAIDRMLKEFK